MAKRTKLVVDYPIRLDQDASTMTIYTLAEIEKRLAGHDNLMMVAATTGLSIPLIISMSKGTVKNCTLNTILLMTDYLNSKDGAVDEAGGL